MTKLKKVLLAASATTAAAGVFFAADATLAQAATETFHGGVDAKKEYIASDKQFYEPVDHEDAVNYATGAAKAASDYKKQAVAVENDKIIPQKATVAEKEGAVKEAQEKYNNANKVYTDSAKAFGVAGQDGRAIATNYAKETAAAEKAHKDAYDKADKTVKDGLDKAENDIYTKAKEVYGETNASAIVAAVKKGEAFDASKLKENDEASLAATARNTKTAAAVKELSEDAAKQFGEKAKVAEEAFEAGKKALEELYAGYAKIKADLEKAAADAKKEADLRLDSAKNSIELRYNTSQLYGKKGVVKAYKNLLAAKTALATAEEALKEANVQLNAYQNQYAILSAKAELLNVAAAVAIKDHSVDTDTDLKDLTADEKATLDALGIKDQKALKAQAAGAAKALDKALAVENTLGDKTPRPQVHKDPAKKVVKKVVKKVDKKADKKADKTAGQKANADKTAGQKAKVLPKTGAVAGSVAMLGLALASAGSAFTFRRKK